MIIGTVGCDSCGKAQDVLVPDKRSGRLKPVLFAIGEKTMTRSIERGRKSKALRASQRMLLRGLLALDYSSYDGKALHAVNRGASLGASGHISVKSR